MTTKDIIIRPETEKDYFQAEIMTKRAFWNLHRPGCDEHYLVHQLRKSEDYLYELSRVAEVDGEIVGAIYYSKAFLLGEEKTDILTFGPLCVDPDYQNTGIGGLLLKETIKLAAQMGYIGIVIFGEPGYYPKHGFKTCDHFGFTTKDGQNFDAFMGYEIIPGGFHEIKGSFYESEVFDNLDPVEVDKYDQKFPYLEKKSC